MSEKNFIIRSINLSNFKLYKSKSFDFNGRNFILVSGANGFGKSTVLDAIEWCITGDVKRITNNFKRRNTNQTEQNRVENNSGIIKNKSAKLQDEISVVMEVSFGDEIIKVKRSQIEDRLNAESKLEFIGEVGETTINDIENAFKSSSFYNYNVCDTYKNYEFLTTNRKDVLDMFREFIKDRPEIESVINNLEKVVEKLECDKLNFLGKVHDTKVLEIERSKLEKLKKETQTLEYPTKIIFQNEIITIDKLDNKGLLNQLERMNDHAYKFSLVKVQDIIRYLRIISDMDSITEQLKLLNSNRKEFCEGVMKKYHFEKNLTEINKKIKTIKDEYNIIDKLDKITQIREFITKNNLKVDDSLNKSIDDLEINLNDYNKISKQIETLSQGNKIIAILSDIVAKKEGLLEYKKEGYQNCPICGATSTFKEFDSTDQIALEAEKYLENNKSFLADLKKRQADMESTVKEFKILIQNSIKILIQMSIDYYEKEKERSDIFVSKFNQILEFGKTKQIIIDLEVERKLEQLRADLNHMKEEKFRNLVEKTFLEKIFSLLKFDVKFNYDDLNSMINLEAELEPYVKNDLSVSLFEFKLFQTKRTCIKSLIDNRELTKVEANYKNMLESNKNLNDEVKKIEEYISKAKSKIKEFNRVNKELEKKELENVGPFLEGIFNKIVKHSTIDGIQLIRDNAAKSGGIVLQDNDKSNLMNTLSEGQLGVMMMSYYFANMYRRKDYNNIKVYMMDDVTNTLDDINLLSFIDMIKYILSDNDRVIDQFFFSTCDENLERLFTHKLKSFNVPGICIKFNSHGEYKSVSI